MGRTAGSTRVVAGNVASLAGGALLQLGGSEGLAGQEGNGKGENGGELHFVALAEWLRCGN